MWRDHRVVGVDHRADHPRAQDAAQGRGIRLQDMDAVVLEQLGELMRGVEALPSGNRHVDAARHLGCGVDLRVVGRLLEPGWLELGDVIADPDGLRDTEAAVSLDHDLDVGTDGLTHRANDVERELAVAGGHRPPGRPERVELEGL